MAYWHFNRILDHHEVRKYRDEQGKAREIKKELVVALAVARRLPDKGQAKLSRRDIFKMTGISQGATTAQHLRNLDLAGLIEFEQRWPSEPYTFALGPALDCENNGCTEPSHFEKGARGLENQTGVEKPHKPGGETTQAQVDKPHKPVEETKPHIRTKEILNNLNNRQEVSEPEEVATVVSPGAQARQPEQPITTEPDAETLDKLERCRTSIRKALAERVNPPVNPNLFEWASLMLTNGVDVLDRTIEYTAQGYDLDPAGIKWRGKSAVIDSELIKIGGNE